MQKNNIGGGGVKIGMRLLWLKLPRVGERKAKVYGLYTLEAVEVL